MRNEERDICVMCEKKPVSLSKQLCLPCFHEIYASMSIGLVHFLDWQQMPHELGGKWDGIIS